LADNNETSFSRISLHGLEWKDEHDGTLAMKVTKKLAIGLFSVERNTYRKKVVFETRTTENNNINKKFDNESGRIPPGDMVQIGSTTSSNQQHALM
jgi:hypothetical protein